VATPTIIDSSIVQPPSFDALDQFISDQAALTSMRTRISTHREDPPKKNYSILKENETPWSGQKRCDAENRKRQDPAKGFVPTPQSFGGDVS